jgi:hypothetical protein
MRARDLMMSPFPVDGMSIPGPKNKGFCNRRLRCVIPPARSGTEAPCDSNVRFEQLTQQQCCKTMISPPKRLLASPLQFRDLLAVESLFQLIDSVRAEAREGKTGRRGAQITI